MLTRAPAKPAQSPLTIYADELRHESEPAVERRRFVTTRTTDTGKGGITIGIAAAPRPAVHSPDQDHIQAALLDPRTRQHAARSRILWRRFATWFF